MAIASARTVRLTFALALLACALLLSSAARAQTVTRLTGSFGGGVDGVSIQVNFTCEGGTAGSGACVGTYRAKFRVNDCTNDFVLVDAISISGLNLSAPGPVSGSVLLKNLEFHDTPNGNGSCSIVPGSRADVTLTFSGTWNGTTATITFAPFDADGQDITVSGTVTAETVAIPFAMTVSGQIDAQTANIVANIQYRPQDVGTAGSVYAFAVAPATIVQPALLKNAADVLPPLGYATARDGRKDTAVACVLAQLNASGQLQAVSASSMQAFVSGVLGSAGQAVAVINGVATASIGGTTFYVGYGTSAQSMLNNGVNRNVVAVPGSLECKPQPPQTGWWWNTAEGGRGYSVEVQGNHIFYAAFLYDDAGRSNWFVATGTTSLDGSLFTGDLLRVTNGQALGGAYRAPGPAASVGPITLAFSGAATGTMVWPGGTVAIERFNIVPNGLAAQPKANQPETGWWWNPAESGRGFFIEWQDGTADLAGYMYDDAGNAVWYLSVVQTPDIRALSGNWWLYANGQSLTGAYKPATRINDNVAPVTVTFTSATTATMTLPNGRTTNLQRHRF